MPNIGLTCRPGCGWLLVGVETKMGRLVLQLAAPHTGKVGASVDWPAGTQLAIRERDERWLFHDSHGRLLDIDTATGAVRSLSIV